VAVFLAVAYIDYSAGNYGAPKECFVPVHSTPHHEEVDDHGGKDSSHHRSLLGMMAGRMLSGGGDEYFKVSTDCSDYSWATISNGWGVPTATDISLAWVTAVMVFGKNHPAIDFLLLIAIVDDACGLIIIAAFYPDPAFPVKPVWLLLVVLGMFVAYGFRRTGTRDWRYYIYIAGPISWFGFLKAGVHAALSLVPIVPFLPHYDVDNPPKIDLASVLPTPRKVISRAGSIAGNMFRKSQEGAVLPETFVKKLVVSRRQGSGQLGSSKGSVDVSKEKGAMSMSRGSSRNPLIGCAASPSPPTHRDSDNGRDMDNGRRGSGSRSPSPHSEGGLESVVSDEKLMEEGHTQGLSSRTLSEEGNLNTLSEEGNIEVKVSETIPGEGDAPFGPHAKITFNVPYAYDSTRGSSGGGGAPTSNVHQNMDDESVYSHASSTHNLTEHHSPLHNPPSILTADNNECPHGHDHNAPLHNYEHDTKLFVDLGMFFFALGNAGVNFSSVGPMTTAVTVGLFAGKTLGIGLMTHLAVRIGLPLPMGMKFKDVWMIGLIAAAGLTVALFVAGQAFTDKALKEHAKLGALISAVACLMAIAISRVVDFKLPKRKSLGMASVVQRALEEMKDQSAHI